MKDKKIDFYHIKGDILCYRPNSFIGHAIKLFDKKYSHVSLALAKDVELDAEWRRGVTLNAPDWGRKPDIIKLPFDKKAYDLTWRKYKDHKYGKLQLFGMTLRNWRIVNTKGAVCSEVIAFYLIHHHLITTNNVVIDITNPNYYTPYMVYELAKRMASK
jgi:hypothetical protein